MSHEGFSAAESFEPRCEPGERKCAPPGTPLWQMRNFVLKCEKHHGGMFAVDVCPTCIALGELKHGRAEVRRRKATNTRRFGKTSRLSILKLIHGRPMTVKQICEATKGARNAVWKAIKRAHAKGLVIVSGSVSLTTDGEEWLLEELETIND